MKSAIIIIEHRESKLYEHILNWQVIDFYLMLFATLYEVKEFYMVPEMERFI